MLSNACGNCNKCLHSIALYFGELLYKSVHDYYYGVERIYEYDLKPLWSQYYVHSNYEKL